VETKARLGDDLNMVSKLTDKTIRNFVLWLIILKPIFDLDWRWPLFYIGSTAIPFHRIVAFAVPAIITIVLVLRLLLNGSVRLNSNILAIFFLVSITITLYFQRNTFSIDEYVRSYSFFIIFLSVPFLIDSKQEFYKMAKLLILISIVPTFLSYLQTFGLLPFTYYDFLPSIGKIGRISGSYRHPTGYSNYLLVLIPLAIYLHANKLISKKYFWFWILFTLPMIGRSLHRATIILVIFQLAIFIFFLRRTLFKYFMITCFFLLLVIYSQDFWQFINIGGAITEATFRGRGVTWSKYVNYFQGLDFSQQIFGFGSPELPDGSFEPHSDWLRIMFNYGYSGFIAYILFLFSILLIFITKLLKIKRKFRVKSEALIGLILVSTIVLYSITMEPLRYSSFSWACALISGYAYMMILSPKKVRLLKK